MVNKAISQCVPKVVIKNSTAPAWIDRDVRHLNNKKKTAWRKAKNSDLPADWAKYRKLRNETQSVMSVKYSAYLDSLTNNLGTNTKRLWSFIRSKTKTRSVPGIVHGGAVETEPEGKAQIFNEYFHSVFIDDDVHGYPNVDIKFNPSLSEVTFSSQSVIKILLGLDTSKACGHDNDISPHILKQCAHQLGPSLTHLFNLCMTSGRFPTQWKRAHIVPVHKKGKRDAAENYRPVSLLSVVSKVMERCVYDHIYEHVSSLLSPLQHGFVKGKSCSTQLLDVYHRIGESLDKSCQTDIIFLDFSKAFDSVSHSLLLHKLQSYGINGKLLNWLRSYLSSRQQRVVIEGCESEWLPVKSGVPQGSILGPLLFLLYINDMPDVVSSSHVALFADDAKCYRSINNVDDCIKLQGDLDKLFKWSTVWKLKFNVKKCQVLSISRSMCKHSFNYSLSGTVLDRTESFKDLGVTISQDLSWGTHVSSLVSKCNQTMGLIKRAVGFRLAPSLTTTLYQSLVRSQIEYASSVWSPHNHKDIRHIESIQRSASRYILHYPQMSYSERCSVLDLMPLSFRREMADLVLLFKYLNNLIDVDFSQYITLTPSDTGLRSGSQGCLLSLPLLRTVTFQNSFFNRVVHTWNSLPRYLRDCTDLNVFKSSLKQFYHSKLVLYDPDIPGTWHGVHSFC